MSNLEKDLERALNEMSADWKLQDNNNDKETNFIYYINSFDELMNQWNDAWEAALQSKE